MGLSHTLINWENTALEVFFVTFSGFQGLADWWEPGCEVMVLYWPLRSGLLVPEEVSSGRD